MDQQQRYGRDLFSREWTGCEPVWLFPVKHHFRYKSVEKETVSKSSHLLLHPCFSFGNKEGISIDRFHSDFTKNQYLTGCLNNIQYMRPIWGTSDWISSTALSKFLYVPNGHHLKRDSLFIRKRSKLKLNLTNFTQMMNPWIISHWLSHVCENSLLGKSQSDHIFCKWIPHQLLIASLHFSDPSQVKLTMLFWLIFTIQSNKCYIHVCSLQVRCS